MPDETDQPRPIIDGPFGVSLGLADAGVSDLKDNIDWGAGRFSLHGRRGRAMTPKQKSGLKRLMLRWPTRRLALERAAEGAILDLYESYEEASLACALWARHSEPTSVAIAEDYRRIVRDLEEEIANSLSDT